MDAERFDRTIAILCPVCGGSHFLQGDSVVCLTCNRATSRDELFLDNQENIQAHIDEISEKALDEIKRNLKKMLNDAFGGNSSIRIE